MTSPTFVANLKTLKKLLRLSGVGEADDADNQISEAVLLVKVGFNRQLGLSRVAELKGYTFTNDPTTNDELLRATANTTEVKWVRAELIRVMPTLFQDGGESPQEAWNDSAVGLYRRASNFDIADELARLESEIAQSLDLLRGQGTPGSETTVRAEVFVPDVSPPRPGDTVWKIT